MNELYDVFSYKLIHNIIKYNNNNYVIIMELDIGCSKSQNFGYMVYGREFFFFFLKFFFK